MKKTVKTKALLSCIAMLCAFSVGGAIATGNHAYAETPTNVILDADGTQVTATPFGSVQDDTLASIFPGATGATQCLSTDAVAKNGTFTITLNQAYKASEYESVKIVMAVVDWDNDGTYMNTTTGYAEADTAFANPAGSVDTDYKNTGYTTLVLDAAKLADADGNIQTILLRKTCDACTNENKDQVHIDYVELVAKQADPVVEPFAPTENTSLDFDGTQATVVESIGMAADNANGVFANATGATKHQWTGGIKDGSTMTVQFEKPISASALKEIVIKMCVGDWVADNNVTTTAYSTTDTAFATPAGSFETPVGDANKECDLVIDPAKVADENGLISAIVLKRTDSVAGSQGQYFFDSVELIVPTAETDPTPDPEPTEPDESIDAVLDADGTQVVLDPYSSTQTDDSWGLFKGATGETMMSSTGKIAVGGTFSLTLNRVLKAEDYEEIKIRLNACDWANDGTYLNTLTGYSVADTEFANPAGYVETDYRSEAILTLDPAKLADADGMIQTIVLKKTSAKADVAAEQVHVDYVEIITTKPDEYSSKLLLAGDLITNKNPQSIEDDQVTWATGRKHEEYEQYGYTTSNLMLGFNKTNFPDFEIYETDVPDYNAIRASKVVVPIKVGKLLASNYAQLEFTFYFTDWNSGMHQFYLYGSNTQKFIEDGKAVGYAAEFVSTGPQTKMKIKVDDVASLADENGYIEYLYIMYYGNILDDGEDVIGCYISGANSSCTQLWLNEVNFYVQEDVKVPVQSEVYIEKDVSEILPVGDGTTFHVESKEENATSIVAAAKTAAYDSLTLTVLPTYAGNFSTAILTHALKGTDKLEDSGIFFSLNNNGIHIGAIKGTTRTDKIVEGNFFPTGVATKVTLNTIPGYLEGVLDGFFLSVYVGDSEEAVIELYVALADANIGSYTNVIAQDLGEDFSIELASANEVATPATDVMNVTIQPKNGGTEFKRERVSLVLDYFKVEGDVVSDLKIVGNATFNAETNFLEFTAPGTVTVSYTVTNAFGTFTSNELTLTYAPETEEPDNSTDDNQTSEEENEGFFGKIIGGCFGGIGSVGVLAPLALAGVALIRRKKNHADENDAENNN